MRDQYPYPEYDAVRSILAGILLSLITCGIYGLYWQYKQMETLNAWLKRDEYSFWQWFFFYLLTCGIYGIYYEYRMASGINEVQENNKLRVDTSLPATCVLWRFSVLVLPRLLSSSTISISFITRLKHNRKASGEIGNGRFRLDPPYPLTPRKWLTTLILHVYF